MRKVFATLFVVLSVVFMSFTANAKSAKEGTLWKDGIAFHCSCGGGNGKVDVKGFSSKDYSAGGRAMPVFLEERPDGKTWVLLSSDFICKGCDNDKWVSYSNKSGVPNGKNIQFNGVGTWMADHDCRKYAQCLCDCDKCGCDEETVDSVCSEWWCEYEAEEPCGCECTCKPEAPAEGPVGLPKGFERVTDDGKDGLKITRLTVLPQSDGQSNNGVEDYWIKTTINGKVTGNGDVNTNSHSIVIKGKAFDKLSAGSYLVKIETGDPNKVEELTFYVTLDGKGKILSVYGDELVTTEK